jgi:hypothetical protein
VLWLASKVNWRASTKDAIRNLKVVAKSFVIDEEELGEDAKSFARRTLHCTCSCFAPLHRASFDISVAAVLSVAHKKPICMYYSKICRCVHYRHFMA